MVWKAILVVQLATCMLFANCQLITDENIARQWLEEFNAQAEEAYSKYVLAHWNYNTNLTDYNGEVAVNASITLADFDQAAYENTTKFDWRNFQDEDIKRQFGKVADIGTSVLTGADLEQYNKLGAELEKIYSTATVCHSDSDESTCLPLAPHLTRILGSSSDWDELVWVWRKWRDESGRKMKVQYEQFVNLMNLAARKNNYEDAGAYWRSWYEDEQFESKCLDLWTQVKPLYQQLHGYVKRKLKEFYKDHAEDFPETGQIPAHLLGNMWSQQWTNLAQGKNMTPYPDFEAIDVTKAMKDQNYDVEKIFITSEDFFTSLNLTAMPQEFWENSMIVKPEDRDVVCHASAWDFYNRKDFRIKQCTEVTQGWLETTHHEMGHIQYFLLYKDQPVSYRDGANPGFHEAVGDVMSLSVATPEHLKLIGLLDNINPAEEYDINYLMAQALERVSFLPFGYLVDQWRWSVLSNQTKPEEYNKKWWQLRCQHQGVSPPVKRFSDDFDPGAKYHIPGNTPYIRYFVSFIIQFQFHKALCDASGYSGPLHRCDIYNNTVAGKKLGDMLKLGSSKPWPDAMEAITGQREMDASALLEFFQPLYDWLEEQNKGYDITWDDDCPEGMVDADLYRPTEPAPTTKNPVQSAPFSRPYNVIFYSVLSIIVLMMIG